MVCQRSQLLTKPRNFAGEDPCVGGGPEACGRFFGELDEAERALILGTIKSFKPPCFLCLSVLGNRLTLWT